MAMKIENLHGKLDTFTWTYNPGIVDIAGQSNHTTSTYGPTDIVVITSSGAIRPRLIPLVGHHSGASKRTTYRSMAKHFRQTTKIKKLYWESDKFYVGIGMNVKQTNTKGRTNFIDYIVTFQTIIGPVMGDTERTSGTNEGDTTGYVFEINSTYDGSGDVTLSDNEGTTITIASGEFSGTEKVLYLMVWPVNSGDGVYVTEWDWTGIEVDAGTTSSDTSNKLVESGQNFITTVTVGDVVNNTTDGTYAEVINIDSDTTLSLSSDIMDNSEAYVIYTQVNSTIDGQGRLRVGAGENITTVSTTNLASVTKRFRDAWYE